MKNLIKKYIGITGFIIALVGVLIAAYHKFYYNDEFDSIGELSLLLWISTLTISNELNKSNPKKWYISCIICIYNILCFLDSLLKPNKTNKKTPLKWGFLLTDHKTQSLPHLFPHFFLSFFGVENC